MVKSPGPFVAPSDRKPIAKKSDAREIVEAVFATYPGGNVLTIADTFTAKWISDDAISVVLHTRADYLDSWFGAMLERVLICRHKNWKRACHECESARTDSLEPFLDINPALRKEPGRL